MTDQDWFAELYRTHYRRLVLAAYALTADLGTAEEITQEAFALAYTRQGRLSRANSPEAWLRTVTVNLARRRWRRRTMLDKLLQRDRPEPAPPADLRTEHAELHAAISDLGYDQRAVVVLHYLADLPVDETARVLGIPVGTVKSRLARARTALAAQLDGRTATESPTPAKTIVEVDHA